ncbi:MAG: ComEC/Rec2 family competence protein [Patescibacteria group bacterium]|jgi:competence protein ComEC
MLRRLAASSSGTLVAWLLAFFGGVAVHAFDERIWLAAGYWLAAAGCFLVALIALRPRPVPRLLAGAALMFALALWRFDAAIPAADPPDEPVLVATELVGTVSREQRIMSDSATLDLDRVFVCDRTAVGQRDLSALADGGSAADGSCRPLAGVLRLRARAWPIFAYGEVLRWRCLPVRVGLNSGDPFDAQAWLDGVRWRCSTREPLAAIAASERSLPRQLLYGLRSRIRLSVGRLLPEPEASFLLGLLIGDRDGLPPDLVAAFRSTGTSHILAVSGYNVARVAEIFLLLFAAATVRRRRAACFSLAGVLIFAVVAGAEASVIRAAAMGCTALVATVVGRRYSATAALSLAASAMLAFDPLLLRHDVGFQLSFAAVLGLHGLGEPLAKRLTFLPEFLGIRRSAGETLGATLATLPIIILAFGRVPLLGPVANLLILPLIPWIMALGAGGIILAAFWFSVGQLPALAAVWLLRVIETIIGFLASLPFSVELQAGPLGCSMIAGWILLLWYALVKAKPIPLRRPPLPAGLEIEVIEYGSKLQK